MSFSRQLSCLQVTGVELMENRVKGYSLWLMPEGEERRELEALILQLSHKLGTPSFLPHVTLLGQIMEDKNAIYEKTARLASSLKDFSVDLNGAGYLDEYFRCLYLIAGEDAALVAANLKARRLFRRLDDPPFMPHLSLVYGSMPVEVKKSILAEVMVGRKFSFQANKISLYLTSGTPHEWSHAQDFPLR